MRSNQGYRYLMGYDQRPIKAWIEAKNPPDRAEMQVDSSKGLTHARFGNIFTPARSSSLTSAYAGVAQW